MVSFFTSTARLFALLLLFLSTASAQSLSGQGWTAFLQNDYVTAHSKFSEALKDAKAKNDALLGMTLLAENGVPKLQSFDYLSKLYYEDRESFPYIYSLWFSTIFSNSESSKTAAFSTFLKDITQREGLDGTLKAMAFSRLGKLYADKKNFAEADRCFAEIGAVGKWQITGEFENISGSGFDKNYPDIIHSKPEKAYINKRGAEVKWFEPKYLRRDRWFDFTNYLDYENSIVFAQTFIKSPTNQEVQLRAGVSGSLKVWLNDQLILSESEERNNDLDSYISRVKLHEGFNKILVQVGESYAGRSNFLIRITDNNGNPVKGLSAESAWQEYKPETSYKPQAVEVPAESYLKDQIKRQPENVASYLLLANVYLQSEKIFEAQSIINKLKVKYPKSTYINTLCTVLYNKAGNRTGLESTNEAIKSQDPEHPLALDLFYREFYGNEDLDKAADYLKKIEAVLGPDDASVIFKKIDLAAKNKNQPELIRLAEDGYSRYPDNASFVEYKYLIEKNIRKNNPAALAALKKYLKENDNYRLAGMLAAGYFDSGNVEGGLKIYRTEIDNDPVSVGIYRKLSDIYAQLQNYTMAEKTIRQAIEIAPYEASYHAALGKLLSLQQKKEASISAYKKALTFNPVDYASIEELRKLENKKDIYSYFPASAITEAAKNAPQATAYPDDNILILNQSVQAVLYPSGASEQRQVVLAKILNTNGLQAWKEYTAPVNNWQTYIIENAEVLKANGTKVPAEVKENQIVFTNLEVGDCVYIKHRLFNNSQGQLSGKFWDTFYFHLGYPYIKSSYSILVAKNQHLDFKFSKKEIPLQKAEVEDFVLYNWTEENQTALKYEDKMPPFDDVSNVLQLTTMPDWRFVSNWYNDLASAKARPDYEVKEVVRELFEGKTGLNDDAKAEIIYNYITRNISYSSVSFRQSGLIPQRPSTVLNTRIGDCKDVSTLFLSMAKEVGLDARLVLVNTRDQGSGGLMLPSINFNHCIVKVNTGGKERFLELTYSYLPFNSLGNYEVGSAFLEIDSSSASKSLRILDPATRNKNNIFRNTSIRVENSDLLVKENNVRVAAAAAYLRENYCNLSENDRFKNMQEAIRSTNPGAELKKLSFTYLENSGKRDTLFTDLEYNLKEDVKVLAGIHIVSLPWTSKVSNANLAVSYPRKFPLDLSQLFYVDSETEVISLKIPDDKKIVETIPSTTISNEFVDYRLEVKQLGRQITLSRTISLKNPMVPAEKVKDFQELYAKIAAADNRQIAIK